MLPASAHAFPMRRVQEPDRAVAQRDPGSTRDLVQAHLQMVHSRLGHEHRTAQLKQHRRLDHLHMTPEVPNAGAADRS